MVLEAECKRREEVVELEKQVVSLWTMLGPMCPDSHRSTTNDAHDRARAAFRAQRHAVSEYDIREALARSGAHNEALASSSRRHAFSEPATSRAGSS